MVLLVLLGIVSSVAIGSSCPELGSLILNSILLLLFIILSVAAEGFLSYHQIQYQRWSVCYTIIIKSTLNDHYFTVL